MKFIKYIFLGALIGFLFGLILAIGTVGVSFDGLGDCFKGFSTCTGGCLKGCTIDCFRGWGDCLSLKLCISEEGCRHCMDPVSYPLETCLNGCEDGSADCEIGTNSSLNSIIEIKSNITDNSKAKNYIIYLTLIGTAIGFVFGAVSTIQDKRKKYQELENNKRKIVEEIQNEFKKVEQEADKNRKERKQIAEDKWESLQYFLNS